MSEVAVRAPSMPTTPINEPVAAGGLRLVMPEGIALSDDLLLEIGARNEGWRFEADAEGALLIMAPAGPASGRRGVRISTQLQNWADAGAGGDIFDASSIFHLPDGNRRSPDIAWLSPERLSEIDADDEGVWRITPDLVIEIQSRNDDPSQLQTKMELWIANGVRLGWLVDPYGQRLWVYRPGTEAVVLERPPEISDDEVLPGLVVDLRRIWQPE